MPDKKGCFSNVVKSYRIQIFLLTYIVLKYFIFVLTFRFLNPKGKSRVNVLTTIVL
jgi:hypothetical protein